jgi:hypothetical protein
LSCCPAAAPISSWRATSRISDLPDRAFAEWMTREVGVAVIPVSVFYADGRDDRVVRFCFAKQEETLISAGRALVSRLCEAALNYAVLLDDVRCVAEYQAHRNISRKENVMGMLQEFKEFAVKGNAMDLAVGVIIGGAFGKIVDSIVGDLIMPLVSKSSASWTSPTCSSCSATTRTT